MRAETPKPVKKDMSYMWIAASGTARPAKEDGIENSRAVSEGERPTCTREADDVDEDARDVRCICPATRQINSDEKKALRSSAT